MASSLEQFIREVDGDSHLRVEYDFGDGFVRLNSSEAERRQAAHDIRSTEDIVVELLRNSRDAHARQIFLAVGRNGSTRTLTIIDDGDGVPAHMQERIFEPRVTSKLDTVHMDKWGVHGRGMALFSIKVNSLEARVTCSEPGEGCAIYVSTDTSRLRERKDQSTFPTFSLSEEGKAVIRGPKNILRTACEFACEHAGKLDVYVGAPAEIAATLYEFGTATLSDSVRFFGNPEDVSVPKRLSVAQDDEGFAQAAAQLGLHMSSRTARRILDGEIEPVTDLASLAAMMLKPEADAASGPNGAGSASGRRSRAAGGPGKAGKDSEQGGAANGAGEPVARGRAANRVLGKAKRGVRLPSFSAEDLEGFKKGVSQAYRDLAAGYYLNPDVEPEVRVAKGYVTVRVPVAPQESGDLR